MLIRKIYKLRKNSKGKEKFRFIHFNLQAIRNKIVETAKGMK